MAEAKKQPKSPADKKSTGKRVLLISGALILVILAGGAGVALRWWQDRGAEQETPTLPPVVDNLQNLRIEDPDAFNEELQNALDNPDLDNDTRALVYIQQGNQAFDNEKFQEAVDAYMNAENLLQNTETAQLLAVAYESLGQNEQAIQYYRLAIERYPTDNPLHGSETEYFQQRINDLSGD